jgi:putative endonuclease
MWYVYVIQSELDPSYFYKGHCVDLDERLKQHNKGQTKSNKHKMPFRVAYFETFENFDNAITREKYFKSAAGRRFLKGKLAP